MSSAVTTIRSIEPTVEPITIAEAKDHVQVSSTNDDVYIAELVVAAREQIEAETDRALITQTWLQTRDSWPVGPDPIELYPCPVQSITSITYIDADGAAQTLDTSVYVLDTNEEPAQVRLKYDQSWPALRGDKRGITITYVAGYGTSGDDVPARAKHALLYLVAWMYELRTPAIVGGGVADLPMAYRAHIDSLRLGVLP